MVNSLNVAPNGRDRSTADRSRDLCATDIVRWVLHWLGYLFVYAWLVLFIALICATFGGLLGETSRHLAWTLGALLGLVGVPTRKVGKVPLPPLRPTRLPPERDTPAPVEPTRRPRPRWVIRDAWRLGLYGLILGMIMGFSLVGFWFSIAVSPFAPALWYGSVTYREEPAPRDTVGHSEDDHSAGIESRHPMLFVLFLVPLITLPLLGFVLGGFGILERQERT